MYVYHTLGIYFYIFEGIYNHLSSYIHVMYIILLYEINKSQDECTIRKTKKCLGASLHRRSTWSGPLVKFLRGNFRPVASMLHVQINVI